MFKVNEYFDGTVKSIAFGTAEGPATIGVMAPGEYEFGTAQREIMHVVSGALTVKLPDSSDWKPRRRQPVQRPGQQQVPAEGCGRHRLPVRIPRLKQRFHCTNENARVQRHGHFSLQ